MNNEQYTDLETRVDQYLCLELPGQPQVGHLGSNRLVRDLFKAVPKPSEPKELGIMLDVETLGVCHDAKIIQVGLLDMDTGAELLVTVDREGSAGAEDASTMGWWSQQPNGYPTEGAVDYSLARQQVMDWLTAHDYGGRNLWCNDPQQDLVWLENWLGCRFPHRIGKSYRTVTWLLEQVNPVAASECATLGGPPAHDALADCKRQALVLKARLGYLL